MKKILFSLLLFSLSVTNTFSQIKLIQGTLLSEKDSSRIDSALVIIYDYDEEDDSYESWRSKKVFSHTLSDSNGVFTFKNIVIAAGDTSDTSEVEIAIEVVSVDYQRLNNFLYGHKDSLYGMEFYLSPYGYYREDTTSSVLPPKPYKFYTNFNLFAGSLFGTDTYKPNYKFGLSISKNYKITPINYLAWEFSPLMYRRYTMKNDSINTSTIFKKEYYASVQSGLGMYWRTHFVTWNRFSNGLYVDVGAEYVCPWHYWYVEKPDKDTKIVWKNFHKYNEVYLNARIGMMQGVSLKGSYRLTDVFRSGYEELPKWSLELQAVFILGYE